MAVRQNKIITPDSLDCNCKT